MSNQLPLIITILIGISSLAIIGAIINITNPIRKHPLNHNIQIHLLTLTSICMFLAELSYLYYLLS